MTFETFKFLFCCMYTSGGKDAKDCMERSYNCSFIAKTLWDNLNADSITDFNEINSYIKSVYGINHVSDLNVININPRDDKDDNDSYLYIDSDSM